MSSETNNSDRSRLTDESDTATSVELLFSYGTLQDAEIQLATFGRLLEGEPDSLSGYCLEKLPFESSPVGYYYNAGRSQDPTAKIVGTRFRLTREELLRSDQYEADADYRRRLVRLDSGHDAWVYAYSESEFAPSE